jgi:hypothetical protein
VLRSGPIPYVRVLEPENSSRYSFFYVLIRVAVMQLRATTRGVTNGQAFFRRNSCCSLCYVSHSNPSFVVFGIFLAAQRFNSHTFLELIYLNLSVASPALSSLSFVCTVRHTSLNACLQATSTARSPVTVLQCSVQIFKQYYISAVSVSEVLLGHVSVFLIGFKGLAVLWQ